MYFVKLRLLVSLFVEHGHFAMEATNYLFRYLLVSMTKTSFKALNFVVSEAAKNKVRLILSLVNNYQDFGWRSQYVDWARNAGVQTSSDDDFYTNFVAYQVGTNFIHSNFIKEIDFTTIHAYPNAWLSAQGDDAQMAFLRKDG
ncbi:Mannan endo-1,4-beta-mannosidase 2 [Sesamum angolense]|uniref:Mannan endo-1,4-beta-mannosidase 2 n=1 Tax=Sesamum angolense TaxID=2727404 RepID=A0AAE1WYU5_9LAMI|nr:Mannan endo-1,4-beta-mannosidase 2 [Sesamum angolense]